METICDKEKCCGCHACFNACPKNAITMKVDNKGFRYPTIDQKKCINCGICKKACPIICNKEEKSKEIAAYACYNKNSSERFNSSSGGIFILLAKEIIAKDGVVFGATFDKDFNVNHSYIDTERELEKFMGSKYTQSLIGDSYRKVKEFLDLGRYVLFTGTPCQIEGLKAYLKKDYDRLYTQDIICHGVPSPKAWNNYLEYQKKKYGKTIKSISFRNKDNGWSKFQMNISFDTKSYSKNHANDIYMKAFLGNICLRDSCYNCLFKKKYRESDITLGDYWGIGNIHPEFNDDKGTSIVVINSKKGKELFDNIKNKIEYIETNLDEAIKYNSAMIKPVNHNKNEEAFINDIDKLEFDLLINKYIPKPSIVKRLYSKTKKSIKKILKK